MKATINGWKITLDNEAVKAIRFCTGFNTNLMVSLKGIREDSLWYWIDSNLFGLFGIDFGLKKPNDPTTDEWDKYERCINDVVRQVIR